ncbi:hypothetical protein COS81_02790 [candidate division WWE3 bacterium CG06_land_8_20_14_3_00_42_16]|uniref:Polymerase nucleotidyl transferase domain-containing protein n=2 Tax=Katanobacteria TaxID=422282 RepID=A0A2M7AMZ3_UNCKA|nr:MAG: hypothetical protein COS81_02790 [candidate division WWE3 bacterium CG06_land_8_20_14_3_00_42_16]PJC68020.1 MAG: hypothetical protein CO015_05535 [candidate division WWE3 bacterium CG_4_8_14_3_um_filter_42_11]
MAQRTNLNRKKLTILRRYARFLRDNGLQIEKMIVFGSVAKGTACKESDLDVCVVSSLFGKDPIEESMRLSKLAMEIDYSLEPHPYSPKDLQEKFDPLAAEIRKHGVEIKI